MASNRRFIGHLYLEKPELLTDAALQELNAATEKDECIINILQNKHVDPIKFQDVTAREFLEWIVTLKTSKRKNPGCIGSLKLNRSGFKHLYREFGKRQSDDMIQELTAYYKGLSREKARGTQTEGGKDPLEFPHYVFFSRYMFQNVKREFIFGRALMILCWNLMCRAANVTNIRYDDIRWGNDALVIKFAQNGREQKYPRHIYAYPKRPEICPILALGMLWSVFGFHTTSNNRLFSGNNQYERFRKILNRLFLEPQIASQMERRGILNSAEAFGMHSLRTGSRTFAGSGSTAGPSGIAIQIRGGNSVGVQDRCFKYAVAGDQYVGRAVAGLPIHEAGFAVMPPHFKAGEDTADFVQKCFPGVPPVRMTKVAEMAAASLVYHKEWIVQNFPNSHPIRDTFIFFQSDLPRVSIMESDTEMTLTGIPPHVTQLRRLQEIEDAIRINNASIKATGSTTVTQVKQLLEERAPIDFRRATTNAGLKDVLMSVMTETGLTQLANKSLHSNPQSNTRQQNLETHSATSPEQVHQWSDGSRHLMPQDFSFPSCNTLNLWLKWCCPSSNHGPLRFVSTSDFYTRNNKKRYSDAKYLLAKIIQKARDDGIDLPIEMTADVATQIFEQCKSVIQIPAETEHERVRRNSQLVWTTVLKHLRQMEKT